MTVEEYARIGCLWVKVKRRYVITYDLVEI